MALLQGSLGRNLLRLASYALGIPFAFLLASLGGALIGNGALWQDNPQQVRIGFLRGAVHYDLLLPLDPQSRADFAFAESASRLPLSHPAAEWLMLGWGSEAVYPQRGDLSEIPPAALWTAATGDRAVMRLDVTTALPQELPGLSWIWVSQAQYAALRGALVTEFLRDQTGLPLPFAASGLTETDSFWRARGRFSLVRSCNQWLGQMLGRAGIPFGRWTPTTQAFELALWWNGRSG